MGNASTWEPWREMYRLQREMERLFAGASPMRRWPLGAELPPINVTHAETGITLEALCPGVDRATLDVSVVGDAVTIRGERKPDPAVTDGQYQRRERALGAFNRTVASASASTASAPWQPTRMACSASSSPGTRIRHPGRFRSRPETTIKGLPPQE